MEKRQFIITWFQEAVQAGKLEDDEPEDDDDARDSGELTAEDRLTKGIGFYGQVNYKESIYHLRIAAEQNLATAVLLYG